MTFKFSFFFATLIILSLQLLTYHWLIQSYNNQIVEYMSAIKILQNWVEQETDTSGSNFQPCLNCGYELAIKKDPFYCLKSDLYKILHPKIVVEDSYVFRDYGGNDLARSIIRNQMFDVNPNFTQSGPMQQDQYFNLDLRVSVLYPYAKTYLRTHFLGKEAGCLFQKYMHIPGQEELALKSLQSLNLRSYLNQLNQVNASIECVNEATFQKKSYRMWEQDECQQILKQILIGRIIIYRKINKTNYIYKTNKHLGRGVLLVDKENEQLIRKQYNNGTFCGKNNQNVIIQEYIKNPYLFKVLSINFQFELFYFERVLQLLLQQNQQKTIIQQYNSQIQKGHKMEFRSYFQIASTNPPILFGYKKALIKQCAFKFNLTDFSKETHVCNTAITKSLTEDIKQQNNEYYIDWNLEELQDLLIEDGFIKSKDWLNDYLMPQIQLKLFHLFNSVKHKLFTDSRVGELFGVDFILDQNLQLWIFECNRNPNFLVVTEGRKEKFTQLIPDMIYLQLRLVRNRFIRISRFLKQKLIPSFRQNIFLDQQELLKHEFLINYQDGFQNESLLNFENQAIDIFPIIHSSYCFDELQLLNLLYKNN